MNIINRFFLKIALWPAPVYAKLGVNTAHLQSIVRTKLIMDDRRPTAIQQTRHQQQKKETSGATIGTMIFSAILGLLYLVAFLVEASFLLQLTIFFFMFIFMLSSTLISDFTSVLIDVRDNFIIMPKPVNDKTVVVARLLHIFIHISKIILPMSLPGVVFIAINKGWLVTAVFLPMILFSSIFSVFLINALYIFILRVTTPQKFQTVISYFQIFFAVGIYAGYQLVPRMLSNIEKFNVDLAHRPAFLLAPPFWFAAVPAVLQQQAGTAIEWAAVAMALVLPFASIYIVVKYLAPSFNRKLTLITGTNTETNAPATAQLHSKRSSYTEALATLLTGKGAERMSFLFTWKLTNRSREFKMKVYPSIGYMLVMGIIMFMNSKGITLQALREDVSITRGLVLMPMYFFSFSMLTALGQIIYSDKYKASWIYFVAPVREPGALISGSIKAIITKFYLPFVLLAGIAGTLLIGPVLIPNIVLAVSNSVLMNTLIMYIAKRHLPFSRPQTPEKGAGQFIRVLFTFILIIGLGVAHFLVYTYFWVVIIFTVLSLIAAWMVMDSIKKTGWHKIAEAAE
jgi:ABC-2 type transport system permease protein